VGSGFFKLTSRIRISIKVTSRIRIRINVMRIRNTGTSTCWKFFFFLLYFIANKCQHFRTRTVYFRKQLKTMTKYSLQLLLSLLSSVIVVPVPRGFGSARIQTALPGILVHDFFCFMSKTRFPFFNGTRYGTFQVPTYNTGKEIKNQLVFDPQPNGFNSNRRYRYCSSS